MQKADLVFAKIVATPTLNSWSQAYNAGSFFAVLSLAKNEASEEDSLNALGKEILELLEKEYFSLEVKNLESIKQAVITTSKKVPEGVLASLVVGSIQTFPANKHVLYVFAYGSGKVILQRKETLGTIIRLERGQANILSASGFLQDKDLIILETEQFGKTISNEDLKNALDHLPPQEIAEALAPKIHEKEEGGACAIIVLYQGKEETKEEEEAVLEPQEEIKKEPLFKAFFNLFKQYLPPLKALFSRLSSHFNTARLTHSRKMLLTISVIIAVLLLMSIFLAVKKKEDAKREVLLQGTISQAQKKYDEGQGLLGLNKNLARDDFLASQKVLTEGQAKFKKGSKEEKKIAELLAKVNEAISTSSNLFLVSAKQASEGTSPLLNAALKNKNAFFVASEGKNVYLINNEGILSEKVIIKKDWNEVGGFGAYLGNFYVLDKKEGQIFKFVPTEGGFFKTNYLASGVSLDFSKAASISIDGSLWVLLSDGTIAKFTKGKIENFTLSGLDKPFSSPIRIFTNADSNNLYILDPQNSRIVVIGKDGTYQAQYQAEILKEASELEVVEKDKKIFILSQSKIYEIKLE